MDNIGSWLRPKTSRRYLHPPFAERMFTLWAEGKLIFGEVVECVDWRSYKELDCSGIWFVYGDDAEQFDFHDAVNSITDDGTPIHGLRHTFGGVAFNIETFCGWGRRPTCFARLTLSNDGDVKTDESFGFLVRSGKEQQLVFSTPDVYASYAPDVNVWKQEEKTWSFDGVLRDGDVFITVDSPVKAQWDEEQGGLFFDVALEPRQSVEIYLSFGKGEALPFAAGDYTSKQAEMREMWSKEFARITKLPEKITSDPAMIKMVRHITAQLLQCFCYPIGKDYLLARQGGMQRLIWPWESIFGLAALGRMGDFGDYIEPVISLYFDHLQQPDGEVRPMGEGWACITSACIGSFARYCLDAKPEFYAKYRDKAMAAFEWVKRTRAQSSVMEGCLPGLFPPKRGCDWGQEFQSWTNTDVFNLEGLKKFVEAAERFDDPNAAEIRAEYEDYFSYMRKYMDVFVERAGNSDELYIPLTPDGNDKALVDDFYICIYHGEFLYLGVVSPENTERVRNYVVRKGVYSHGLHGHMPYRDGNQHIWYTTFSDFYWFFSYMRLGQRERAFETMDAQIRYSMSDEYCMIERYADNDPYYLPWSPNASANGRLLLMLMEYYK